MNKVDELPLCSTYREFINRFGGSDFDVRQKEQEKMIRADRIINDIREFMGLKRLPGGDVPVSQRPINFGQM